jgi:hypothetical protein
MATRPGDAEALAERITTLAGDRAALAQMSAAARDHFERLPTWDDSCAAIRAFLLDITG